MYQSVRRRWMNVSWHRLLSLRAGPFLTFMLDSLSISVPVGMPFVLVRISMLCRDTMTAAALTKEKI